MATWDRPVDGVDACIVGGGPAGMVLGLLLARAGRSVLVLEKHADFLRDFRGDTLHPSVLEVLDQLGLAERLRALPHTEVGTLTAQGPDGARLEVPFRDLRTPFPFVALVPQWDFLDLLATEAARFPGFRLVMRAEVRELVVGGGVVRGVRWTGPEGPVETRALLTVGADGRSSRTRALAGLHAVAASPPMDVLWFRLTRRPDDGLASTLRFGEGHLVALLERDTSWQVGWIVPKGAQPEAEPIEDLRDAVVAAVPELADRVGELRSWADVSRLTVRADRLRRWYVPGYLAIGDAAHAMSPVGGVGINVAIQDAVSAANALWRPLGRGRLSTGDLRRVQRRRALPVRMIQGVQAAMHRGLVTPALERRSRATALGLRAARLLRRPFARMIALGPLRPRVRSPGPTRPGGRPRGGG